MSDIPMRLVPGNSRVLVFVLVMAGILLSLTSRSEDLLPGLVAQYTDKTHTLKLVVPTPNFYLEPQESVHPALSTAFEAEWSGLLSILQTGAYKFESAAEIYLDGNEIAGKTIQLESGRHPIRLKFIRRAGVARLQLNWTSNHFALEPVPSSVLFHQASVAPGPDEALVEKGRYLVEELGCINCHATDSASLQKRFGPRLTGVGSRINSRWLDKWLEDASSYRADAVMPSILDPGERRDAATYLASLTANRPREIKRPSRQDMNHGRQLYGSLGCAACHGQQDLSLEGIGSKTTISSLADYLKDPSTVDPTGRMPSLMLNDEEAFQLAASLVESRNPAFERPVERGDPVRGKETVRSRGCLACHALDDAGSLENTQTAPRLEQLLPERGCLATEPRAVPRYRLNADQRGAMQAFLRSFQRHRDRSPAPVYGLHRTLDRLRCIACHQVDHRGATGAPAEAAPPLIDTGAKQRTRWIAEVLTNRKRVLDWLELRMPDYDAAAVQPLINGFAKAAGVEPGDGPPAPPATDAQRSRGVDLIGMNLKKGGMACVGCHDLGDFKSQGEQGPQLANVADRLRYDWFQRWMRDPPRILSGTSMPNYFRSMKHEEANAVIHTLWAALSLGADMPLPEGLRGRAGVLGTEEKPVPDREAIVIRWDMPEATPAAIAVGMPGKISYCFDAGESRLRYAWHGGFVDMSGTLHRKVDESRLTPTAKLVGEIFYRAEEFPLRVATLERTPERRFRGYRIVDGYPQFHYQVDGIDVYERIVPAKTDTGLTREFRISRVDKPMWLIARQTSRVVVRSTIGTFQDGKLSIPRGNDVRFEVTIVKQE